MPRSCTTLQLQPTIISNFSAPLSHGTQSGTRILCNHMVEHVSMLLVLTPATHSTLCWLQHSLNGEDRQGTALFCFGLDLSGKHCDTIPTMSLGLGTTRKACCSPAAAGENQMQLSLKFRDASGVSSQLLETTLLTCNFYTCLILEQMAFHPILFQKWNYLWA